MSKQKRGLGRGLDALLGKAAPVAPLSSPASTTSSVAERAVEGELRELPLDIIRRGKYQPRMDMHPETLEDLANSIKAQGVVQPIVVRPLDSESFEIIAGERRWRASQLAGLQSIPAIIRNVPDEAAVAMALIENIQREELNPIEEAIALQRLSDEFDMTHMQVAEAVGRSRAAVTNLLRLLTLSEEVKRMVSQGELEMGHARAILTLSAPQQIQAARTVVAKGLSVRETERLVRRLLEPPKTPDNIDREDPNIRRMQEDLSERLGAQVKIHHGAKGKGKLEIQYNSVDELDGIVAHIK